MLEVEPVVYPSVGVCKDPRSSVGPPSNPRETPKLKDEIADRVSSYSTSAFRFCRTNARVAEALQGRLSCRTTAFTLPFACVTRPHCLDLRHHPHCLCLRRHRPHCALPLLAASPAPLPFLAASPPLPSRTAFSCLALLHQPHCLDLRTHCLVP